MRLTSHCLKVFKLCRFQHFVYFDGNHLYFHVIGSWKQSIGNSLVMYFTMALWVFFLISYNECSFLNGDMGVIFQIAKTKLYSQWKGAVLSKTSTQTTLMSFQPCHLYQSQHEIIIFWHVVTLVSTKVQINTFHEAHAASSELWFT